MRFTKESHNLTTKDGLNKAKREILGHIRDNQEVHLWASLPCKPWSQRNVFNSKRLGKKLDDYLNEIREESLLIIESFLSLAYVALKGKGQLSYEWPAYAVGWKLPKLENFSKRTVSRMSFFMAVP